MCKVRLTRGTLSARFCSRPKTLEDAQYKDMAWGERWTGRAQGMGVERGRGMQADILLGAETQRHPFQLSGTGRTWKAGPVFWTAP